MTQGSATYTSPKTGAIYPIAWSVTIPDLKIQIGISTPLKDQEFVSRFGPSYWEGAIDVSGHHEDKAVSGTGYLEMTGYANVTGSIFSTSPR